MTTIMRYDRMPLKATRNDQGFIIDAPILTRTGVFAYRDAQGKERKEYRPPEVVFAADSLAAYRTLPITDGHPGVVTTANVKAHLCGTVVSAGRQDGNDLVADIVIHNVEPVEAGRKQLSVGYGVEFDETPGISPEGERYDAKQTRIMPNHLALCRVGRAGNARLNLDAADAANEDEEDTPTMTDKLLQIRLDSGLSYPAAPEVSQELETLRAQTKTLKSDLDKQTARADSAEASLKTEKENASKFKQDAEATVRAELAIRSKATELGVQFKQDASNRVIQEAVVTHVRGAEFKMDGKSDEYVQYAFDAAVAEASTRRTTTIQNRQLMNQQLPQTQQSGERSDALDSKQPSNGALGSASQMRAQAFERMRSGK